MIDDDRPPPNPQGWLAGFDAIDVDPDRNTWTTPKEWTDAIGPVDLDPCSNPRATVQAKKTFSLENNQDGLAMARYVGRNTLTFINPPYGPGLVMQWVMAYRHTRFIYLVRNDTSTEWFSELEPYIGMICAPRKFPDKPGRIQFVPPPGAKKSSADSNHYLYYANADDVTPEVRRLCYCWRPDRFFHREHIEAP